MWKSGNFGMFYTEILFFSKKCPLVLEPVKREFKMQGLVITSYYELIVYVLLPVKRIQKFLVPTRFLMKVFLFFIMMSYMSGLGKYSQS